jgi:nitrite reductase/ring-hydroxylating ferredoxin subunit
MVDSMRETWISLIKDQELVENSRRALLRGGKGVLLIRLQGNEIYAIANQCPHLACPLAKGTLLGYVLTCPCHEWRFDIRSGEFLDAREIKLPVYQTQITDGSICVRMGEP